MTRILATGCTTEFGFLVLICSFDFYEKLQDGSRELLKLTGKWLNFAKKVCVSAVFNKK